MQTTLAAPLAGDDAAVGSAPCSYGGTEVQSGTNDGSGGFVGTPTVTYVCNGAPGATGAQGDAGAESLVSVSQTGPSTQCPAGGDQIQVGIDTNGNGVLDPSEVTQTVYACNAAACTAGTTQCSGSGVQTCGASLQWSAPVPCGGSTPACLNGACVTCAPASLKCTGEQPVVCNSVGYWQYVGPACDKIRIGGSGESCCNAACVDTMSDGNNCGGCSIQCTTNDPNASGASCNGGQCVVNCKPGFAVCGGTCINVQTDPNNCGGCGQTCSGSCTAGTCFVATAISAGLTTCAVLFGGTVDCWGDNTEGELGNGSALGPLLCVDTNLQCSDTPAPVNGVAQITSIAVGEYHVCGLQTGGTVTCWGYNAQGQLGNGETSTTIIPSAATVPGLTGVVAISAGEWHTCALINGGTVDCWGSSSQGQIGNGTNGVAVPSPVAVPGLTNVTAIAAGFSHTCALVSDGTVRCWGDNGLGQLGLGSTSGPATCNSYQCSACGCSTGPLAVPGLTNVIAIAAGTFETCALISDGTVKCWGFNNYGQLGVGESTGPEVCAFGSNYPCSTSPVAVVGLSGATAISLGQYPGHQACALVAGGGVRCWGWNVYGQLGNGSLTGPETCAGYPCSTTPVAAGSLTGVTAIAAGGGQTCAILQGGAVDCWGYASDGAVGNGTTGGPQSCNGGGYACSSSPLAVVW